MKDVQIEQMIEKEAQRQLLNIELIASENYVSDDVLQAAGSILTNKYAEGYPSKRYYGGCFVVDEIEELARERAKKLFGAEHANVQPHSGAQANMAVYMSVLKPGDKVLGMNLTAGGHLTHGHPLNFSGLLYQFIDYGVDPQSERIDYEAVRQIALKERPKLIVAGASAYPRVIDFAKFRAIADECGAMLMVDMAHIAGLVAAGVHPSPVPYADFVTTTTHKTLRGPRGGMVLCRKEYAAALDKTVFPGMQGGPLMHIIAAKAVCLYEAMQPQFRDYAEAVVRNCKVMADKLQQDTGVVPLSGLLDKGGELDPGSSIIVDTLTPDHSILDDIEYKYPAAEDTHFAYSTRGCIRHCPFCAVPKLEPVYKGYIDIKPGFREASALREAQGKHKFRRLVLMDNNVLASRDFGKIIDDIKELGFGRYSGHGARKTVDFNQGLDARLLTEEKCARLAEIEIDPLRIAFDDWNGREIYEKAVRTAVKCGIRRLSNYLLYNFNDKPEELFLRLQMNVRLCEELGADIYSFPMKYQPINDPEYFNNRNYTGPHWNKKFIRAVQNLLICTSGKIGKGTSYFECAFGRTPDEFMERLWTPEAFLRNREYYAEETAQWRAAMARLTSEERSGAERIISLSLPGVIKEASKQEESQRVRDSLNYYVAYGDGKKRVTKEVKECPA